MLLLLRSVEPSLLRGGLDRFVAHFPSPLLDILIPRGRDSPALRAPRYQPMLLVLSRVVFLCLASPLPAPLLLNNRRFGSAHLANTPPAP